MEIKTFKELAEKLKVLDNMLEYEQDNSINEQTIEMPLGKKKTDYYLRLIVKLVGSLKVNECSMHIILTIKKEIKKVCFATSSNLDEVYDIVKAIKKPKDN